MTTENSRAASANETGSEVAKPRNRSAEWGGYLATNAERLIEAVNALHELEMREDDGEEVSEDDLQHARETLSEYMGAVRSSIYDFRRRTKQDSDEAVARSPAMAAEAAPPSGYAYRYPSLGGTVIRFNGGKEVNGSRPIEAIPYWFAAPQTAQADARVGLTDEQREAIDFVIGWYEQSTIADNPYREHIAALRALLQGANHAE